jgi:hypothetical protein
MGQAPGQEDTEPAFASVCLDGILFSQWILGGLKECKIQPQGAGGEKGNTRRGEEKEASFQRA